MSQLIVVFLRGGADGLSLLAPVGDARYHDERGELALSPESALALDGAFALHPGLGRLHRHHLEGRVAFVPAIGIPDLSRSHFDAQFRVEEAVGATGPSAGAGWLGRHLAVGASGDPNPFRGVCFGQAGIPHLLAGTTDAIAASSLAGLRLGVGPRPRQVRGATRRDAIDGFVASITEVWDRASDSSMRSSALAGLDALDTAAALDPGDAGSTAASDTVVALSAGIGVETAVVNLGGWDTHQDQGNTDGAFAGLVAELDATLETLVGGAPDATVVVLSEFGRRVAPNSSGGCDHGRGGLAIVVGPQVAGGVRGEWPGLAELDDGDVRTANDTRVLMAEITSTVLGSDPEVVLGEVPPGSLALFA